MTTKGKALMTAAAALTLLSGVTTTPSYAGDGGAIALGAIGGFVGGAMLGSALSGPRYYAPPPPPRAYGYRAAYPVYGPVYDECTARRVWGPYGWRWVHYC